MAWIAGSLLVVLLCASAVGAYRWFARGRVYVVPGASMEPSIAAGDRILCTRTAPARIDRGAVVVFVQAPFGDRQRFVQRVIGLPGERVSSPDGVVIEVDGRRLDEPYAAHRDSFHVPFPAETLPADAYFLVGDNRDRSFDSRFKGPVPRSGLKGVCTRIISPRGHRGRIPGT